MSKNNPGKPGVSVVIPVKNEETNLPACLQSLRWADEVFLVDSHSTDSTLRIAKEFGCNIVQFEYQGRGPKKKAWALDNLPFRNEWVLFIDADEQVTPALRNDIITEIARPDAKDGYMLKRKLIFMGRWLKRAAWYPNWVTRLVRHNNSRLEKSGSSEADPGDVEAHEKILVDGEIGYLKGDLIHQDRKDLYHYIARMNRYSNWNARTYQNMRGAKHSSEEQLQPGMFGDAVQRRRFLKQLWVRMPCRPVLRFIYEYFLRLSFLEGRPALIWCGLKAIQEFHISAKIYETDLQEKRRGCP